MGYGNANTKYQMLNAELMLNDSYQVTSPFFVSAWGI